MGYGIWSYLCCVLLRSAAWWCVMNVLCVLWCLLVCHSGVHNGGCAAWCYMILRDVTWCCVMLRHAAWCCVMMRDAAWCCVVLCDAACCEVIVHEMTEWVITTYISITVWVHKGLLLLCCCCLIDYRRRTELARPLKAYYPSSPLLFFSPLYPLLLVGGYMETMNGSQTAGRYLIRK